MKTILLWPVVSVPSEGSNRVVLSEEEIQQDLQFDQLLQAARKAAALNGSTSSVRSRRQLLQGREGRRVSDGDLHPLS